MAIELSYERFNNEDDIVPWYSREEVILNTGFANTLGGNDKITGVGPGWRPSIYESGIINSGTLYTDQGNDMITGTYDPTKYYVYNANYVMPNNGHSIYRDNTGNFYYPLPDLYGPIELPVNDYGIYNSGTIDTGMGDDTITGSNITGGGYFSGYLTLDNTDSVAIYNGNTIKTGGGADSLISDGQLINYGGVFLEDGNDTITSYGVIYNSGRIETGNGNDSIIADSFYGGFDGLGSVSLGNGNDYINGFGNGTFYGGDDEDTLELTPGSYIVGRSGSAVTFTKGSSVMITSDFDKLRVNSIFMGSRTYDFSSLIHGQIISV